MRKRRIVHWPTLGIGLCCALMLTGCKDSDFDFDNIDSLLGLGGEELVLPSNNSTKPITLDDFLELNNSDFVEIDENYDSAYVLKMIDEDPHTTTSTVDPIRLTDPERTEGHITIPAFNLSERTSLGNRDISPDEAEIASFDFRNRSVSEDIDALDEVSFDDNTYLTLTITVPSVLTQVRQMVLTFPNYFELSALTVNGNSQTISAGNKVTLNNLPQGRNRIRIRLDGIKFGLAGNSLGSVTFNATDHTIDLSAKVTADVTINTADFNSSSTGTSTIAGAIAIDDITVDEATGRFSPDISFGSLGNVSLNNIPDFLTDNQVTLDLYDPHINIDFDNNLPLGGKVSGVMRAIDKQGHEMVAVSIPEFTITSGSHSIISLRRQQAEVGGDTIAVVVPDLSDLVRKIPARIEFTDIQAHGDGSETATIQMGTKYEVNASYSFWCPLEFDDDAVIVYTDSLDGWNDGVKDMQFRENSDGSIDGYLLVNADVYNTVPAYMNVSAVGMDLNGREMSTDDIEVTVDKTIAASTDGDNPVLTQIEILMKPKKNGVFKNLDGLKYRLEASARNAEGEVVTGKMIKANQTIRLENIKVTKHGKVVYDGN